MGWRRIVAGEQTGRMARSIRWQDGSSRRGPRSPPTITASTSSTLSEEATPAPSASTARGLRSVVHG
jgi:hypothetical protein